jgi:hypothetical protein
MISASGKALLGLSFLAALAAVLWPSAQLPSRHHDNSTEQDKRAEPHSAFASFLGKCPLGYESSDRAKLEGRLPQEDSSGTSLGSHIWSHTQRYQLYYNATIWTADEQVCPNNAGFTTPAAAPARSDAARSFPPFLPWLTKSTQLCVGPRPCVSLAHKPWQFIEFCWD